MRIIPLIVIVASLWLIGCQSQHVKQAILPVDVQIVRYHVEEYRKSLEKFLHRLYLKNPKYEQDLEAREVKIGGIFHYGKLPDTEYNDLPSNKILEAAFTEDPAYEDRVYLLGLGLMKSIQEAYNFEKGPYATSAEIPLENLQSLYFNVSHVNWRLKVYRDEQGRLLFLTNEAGEDSYINMGYEVIITQILTRIEDDIFLRNGATKKFMFNMSTLFLSILL
ncbi:MAG: hypothetical protein GY864_02025 [Desulfobacterales bacterium]|nr:hypothetical protein [Desulfobacterales bacterium]